MIKFSFVLLVSWSTSMFLFVSYVERQDEVVYYDAYESPDAMQATDEVASSGPPLKDDVTKLQQKTRQLEARRGRITAKKAYLRNKKVWAVMLTLKNKASTQLFFFFF